jgi:hypothetical protein
MAAMNERSDDMATTDTTSTTSRIGETASAAAEAVKDKADYVSERIRDDYETTERRARQIVEEYPLTCFFGAVITGYLIGRIASRI